MKFDRSKLTIENYIQEVAEAFVTLLVLKFFMMYIHKKKNDVLDVLSMKYVILLSLIIGLITMFIEFISSDLKSNIKSGLGFSCGVFMLNGAF